jgi:hypothetical protein
MTGRRLYDRYCDARKGHEQNVWNEASSRYVQLPAPKAWPYLEAWERRVWGAMAAAITKGARYR